MMSVRVGIRGRKHVMMRMFVLIRWMDVMMSVRVGIR